MRGFGASLALSFTAGSTGVTVLAVCGVTASALAFGGWVLSTGDRTERLERLIRALRGRTGRHGRTHQKK